MKVLKFSCLHETYSNETRFVDCKIFIILAVDNEIIIVFFFHSYICMYIYLMLYMLNCFHGYGNQLIV